LSNNLKVFLLKCKARNT